MNWGLNIFEKLGKVGLGLGLGVPYGGLGQHTNWGLDIFVRKGKAFVTKKQPLYYYKKQLSFKQFGAIGINMFSICLPIVYQN